MTAFIWARHEINAAKATVYGGGVEVTWTQYRVASPNFGILYFSRYRAGGTDVGAREWGRSGHYAIDSTDRQTAGHIEHIERTRATS